ncbi:MAG: MlaD family protein [Acidobacteriota bacterium]
MRYSHAVSVGVFVLVALGVAAVGILAIGRESRLFAPKIEYWTGFSNITGLFEGAPVRLAGVQVGTVRRISFPEEIDERNIRVVLSVDRSFRDRIRTDSRAQMRALTYISIEKFIEITTGSSAAEILEDGDYIAPDTTEFERLQATGQTIAVDIQHITATLRALLEAISEGQGVISEMFFNKDFGKETMDNLAETTKSFKAITAGIENQEGLLGRLLLDSEYAGRQLATIESSTSRLDSILAGFQAGEGAIGDLISDTGRTRETLDDFAVAVANLKEASESLRTETGLIGKLLHDDAYAKDLLEKIHAIAANMESISAKLDQGKGTLGRLLNDPEVYEGLQDVVGGIRDSRVISAMIRKYGKRGARERVERALELLEEEEKAQQRDDQP